jgi:hypothetical protein
LSRNIERVVAAVDPELAGAEAAEGVSAGDEGRTLVAHHAHAGHEHQVLPPLAVVLLVVALAFLSGDTATIILVFSKGMELNNI